MSNFKMNRLGLLFCLATTLSACAGLGGETVKTAHASYRLQSLEQLDDRQRADLYEAIIAADMAEYQKDYQTAMSNYLFAADLSKDPQLIEKSVELARLAKDPLGMEQAAQIWLAVDADNFDARILLLEAQIAQQDGVAAAVTAKSLLGELDSSDARYQILERSVINQDPRISFNLLRDLLTDFPQEVALQTAIGKLIMLHAAKNKQPDNMLNQALKTVEEALKLDPKFIPAIRIKSHILFQLGRDDEVRGYLSEIANAYPNSAEINQMLGQLLYDLHDFAASAAHYTDWLLKHPDDLDSRFYLAASYYAMGQFNDSLQQFNRLLDADYKVEVVAFYCGDSALKIGQNAQAIECFKQVNEGRFYVVAKIQLAHLYAEQKQYDKALTTLKDNNLSEEKERIKLIDAEINLLATHFSKEKAKARLQQALTEMPDNLVLILKKIDLFELGEKPQELLPLLRQAQSQIQTGPKLDEFNLAAAALLNNYGHGKMAIDWLEAALINKPNDKDLLYARAIYKEPLGLLDQMLDEFKQLHSLYPDDLNIQNALGYSLADQGKELNYAYQLIEEAYRGLPENPAVIDSKGWIAYRMGNLNEAIKFLSTAFNLSPSADIAAHLGEVLWQNEKKEMALDIWRKGLILQKDNPVLKKTLERFDVEL